MNSASFEYLRTFVKQKSGIDLAPDKMYLVESRLQPLARKGGHESLDALVQSMKEPSSTALRDDVIEAMTTNESSFFRDKTPFELFSKVMLPDLIEQRGTSRRLRIWCAAASTGQEPYSLAISLKELPALVTGWNVSILGTDLSRDVLEKAKSGVYTQFEVQRGLPIQLLLKYFQQEGETWRIDPTLRSMCDFRPYNLLESYAPLGKFDIIFCRNVLIYFDQQTKADILNRLAQQLAPDGYLVLGSAETVMGITKAFEQIPGQRGLYRRADAAGEKPGAAAGTPAPAAAPSTADLRMAARALGGETRKPAAADAGAASAVRPLRAVTGGQR